MSAPSTPGPADADRSTETDGPVEPDAATDPKADADRRRRRAKVFGDVLPDRTRDERGDGWSEPDAGREAGDEWLRRQVPPHHG